MESSGQPVRYLPATQIYDINADIIATFGGWLVRYPNLLEDRDLVALLATLEQTVFGVDLFPTVVGKAAALAWSIITGHPFHDTNKRTGMQSAIEFLEINGYRHRFEPEEIVQVALAVEAKSMSQQALSSWIGNNVSAPGRQ